MHADAIHPNQSLAVKLEALYGLHPSKTVDLTIRKPYLGLLEKFGNPHRHLPPVIHVAGTNGKGSTIAFMRAILEAAGYRVHVYTSPHLIRFNERIVLAGREIGDDALESLLDEALRLNGGGEVTFFEMTTALAFAAFARTPADILLLETGLGGRLDSTNVVEHPIATVITSIGYDHMEFLGETLEAIAAEKAGIMKRGVPCIVAPQAYAAAMTALRDAAALRGAPTLLPSRDWRVEHHGDGGGAVIWRDRTCGFPRPALPGPYQVDNAATALLALHMVPGLGLTDDIVTTGLRAARWPGRLQCLDSFDGEKLAPATELWLDGAHNKDAALALAGQLAIWRANGDAPLHLVVAMLAKRPPGPILEILLPFAASITTTAVDDGGGWHTASVLAQVVADTGFAPSRIKQAVDLRSAVSSCIAQSGRTLVTGSLYAIGKMLKFAK